MTVETNIQALRSSNQFWQDLLPDNALIKARQDFDQAGKNPDPSNYAKIQKRLIKTNNLCAKLVRQQYFPLVKSMVLAFVKDYKLSAEEMNKDAIYRERPLDGQITYDTLFHVIMGLMRTSIERSNAYLHIANAVKPMILKALKELQTERVIVAHKPHRRAFGKVSTYEICENHK